jgi:GMP synthase-like glutamine amidotransferase
VINIFVTYRCNLACPYCFARELQADFPHDLDQRQFRRLLEWMQRGALPAAAFIGGEPTLHPGLAEMVRRTATAGISVVLFTNGVFPSTLLEEILPHVANFVVNYNDPSLYTAGQEGQLHANLGRIAASPARLTFSKNFSSRYCDYGYLLAGAERYGVRSIRYDISRPSLSGRNDHVGEDDTGRIVSLIVGFVKACEARGIRTGLDCSVRLCDLRVEDRNYLERVSMKFSGVCHPSIDIHPDLSASYCLPLRDVAVPDVTSFANHEALMWHFAGLVRSLRQRSVSTDCLNCKDFMRRCQGGCIALRRRALEPLQGPLPLRSGPEGGTAMTPIPTSDTRGCLTSCDPLMTEPGDWSKTGRETPWCRTRVPLEERRPDGIAGSRILVVQHCDESPGGVFTRELARAGQELILVRPAAGDGLPASPAGFDRLVVLGGPQHSFDDRAAPHFSALMRLMRDFDAQGRAVAGICLGCQLLARAYGGRMWTLPALEFGFVQHRVTPAGKQDPVVGPLQPLPPLMEFHEDSFDLPAGAELLIEGAGCINQCFRIGNCSYGFQFHLEADAGITATWIDLFKRGGIANYARYRQQYDKDFFAGLEARLPFLVAASEGLCRAVARNWLGLGE